MARIPEQEIERLKQEISLQRLVEAKGIELQRHGADLIGRCPFHDDRTPSLVISPQKNLWHCLGACQMGGTVIDWIIKTEGVSFRHAVELLRAGVPSLAASESQGPVKVSTVRKLAPPVERDADDRALLKQVLGFYHETLKQSPEALAYLEKRGLRHPEVIEHFQLGFANRTLGLRLPAKNRQAGAQVRGRLQRLGILRESGHEHFNGSLVIPVFEETGEASEVYGRKITECLRPGTPLHLYLRGSVDGNDGLRHRGVWNEAALAASKEIILCEALLDALTFWCAGFRNVTASYGVGGFTADHRAAFAKHATERVWIAYDRDEAGDQAAAALAKELTGMGIECFRVLFPKGMDANEYALKVQPASKSLGVLLHSAQWLGKGAPPERGSIEVRTVPAAMPQAAPAEEPAAKEEPEPEPPARKTKEPESVFSLAAEATASGSELPSVAAPAPPVPVEIRSEEIVITLGDRRYRIRGFGKNTSYDLLKINLLASRGDAFHVDTFDFYAARQRAVFTKQAALEMGLKEEVVRGDLGRVLLELEARQDAQIRQALEPEKPRIEMSADDRAEALALLRDPRLLERIVEDFAVCGVVGEESNKLIGYLAVVSRHLDAPLALLVQSSSAAGKSSLMDAVLQFVPEEDRIHYSAMTGQSLYYMGEMDLKHKVLAIAEEGGASRAAYALKLLQSEGLLSIASTGKDPATGRLVTQQYRVEGPVMMFLTTTAIDVDEELLNRCLVLTVNEDREQTQAIHRLQRERQTLEGLLRRQKRQALIRLHQNAQRLLAPLFVVNPYAPELTFPDGRTRMRRDHGKYLALISAIALLYQHQRTVRTAHGVAYVEATREDIATADRLMKELLARSLDELPPQTRRLLTIIEQMAAGQKGFRFSRRDVREHTGWGATQIRLHLDRLQEMEYLIVHRGGRGLTFLYEYDSHLAALEEQLAGAKRPQNGGMAAPSRANGMPVNTGANGVFAATHEKRMSWEA